MHNLLLIEYLAINESDKTLSNMDTTVAHNTCQLIGKTSRSSRISSGIQFGHQEQLYLQMTTKYTYEFRYGYMSTWWKVLGVLFLLEYYVWFRWMWEATKLKFFYVGLTKKFRTCLLVDLLSIVTTCLQCWKLNREGYEKATHYVFTSFH